jgi:nitrogen regulatory protein P-II 1
MQKIEAVIRKLKFRDVKVGLRKAGYNTFTYWAVRSVSENSDPKAYEEEDDDAVASERVMVTLVVRDEKVDNAIDVIVSSGQTHGVDDGVIIVSDVPNAFQIVGNEEGDKKFRRI